ncbi:hypothetical protein VKT23_004543 [Stygiomarasmius scandens]|uniref:Uncharacterized protein n=1 Tax=Marasmiellus scandens TaxID=2682957 RepID=A0ABR1JUI9_9AGAR
MENDNATSSEIQRYMDSLPEPDRAEFAAFLTWIAGLTPAQCQDYMDGKLLPSVDNGYSFQRTNVQVGGQSVGASAARGFAGPGQANITPSPVQAGVGPTTRDQRRVS